MKAGLTCSWAGLTATIIDVAGNCAGFNGLTIPLTFTSSPPNIRGSSGDNNQKCDVNGFGGAWYGSTVACGTNIQIEVCCGNAIACNAPPGTWTNAAIVFSLTDTNLNPQTGCSNAVNHGACVDQAAATCSSFTFNNSGTEAAMTNFLCTANELSCCNVDFVHTFGNLKVVLTSP